MREESHRCDWSGQHTVLSSAEPPHEHDYASIPNYFTISECEKTAVVYISGYVARMVEKWTLCCTCNNHLYGTTAWSHHTFILTLRKNQLQATKVAWRSQLKMCSKYAWELNKCWEEWCNHLGPSWKRGMTCLTLFLMQSSIHLSLRGSSRYFLLYIITCSRQHIHLLIWPGSLSVAQYVTAWYDWIIQAGNRQNLYTQVRYTRSWHKQLSSKTSDVWCTHVQQKISWSTLFIVLLHTYSKNC